MVYEDIYDKIPQAPFASYGMEVQDGLWIADDKDNEALRVLKAWGPAFDIGILPNDFLTHIQGVPVKNLRQVLALLADSAVNQIAVAVERASVNLTYKIPKTSEPCPDLGQVYPFLTAHQKRCAVCFANTLAARCPTVEAPTNWQLHVASTATSQCSQASQRSRQNSVDRREREIERKLESAQFNRMTLQQEVVQERENQNRRWADVVQRERDERERKENRFKYRYL